MTLLEIINRLSFLAAAPSVVLVMITAGILVVSKDWRLSVLALVIQYILVGLLMASVIRPELAAIKTLAGSLICLILYMTARRVNWGQPRPIAPAPDKEPDDEEEQPQVRQWTLPTELPFRLLAAILVIVVVYSGGSRYPLPDVDQWINLASYMLAALGLLALGLTDEPLKAGMGLLTFVSAFELFYTVLEPSLSVAGFMGIFNFLIALAISYLTVARAAALAEVEQGEWG